MIAQLMCCIVARDLKRGGHSVVETIGRYLDCLPEPVVPNKYRQTLLSTCTNAQACWQVLNCCCCCCNECLAIDMIVVRLLIGCMKHMLLHLST